VVLHPDTQVDNTEAINLNSFYTKKEGRISSLFSFYLQIGPFFNLAFKDAIDNVFNLV
jgi:hypothetical protein